MDWIKTSKQKPEVGSIVEIKTRKGSCSCQGYEERECYYDENGFNGLKHQFWVDMWRASPANNLIKSLEERKKIRPQPCENCIV